MEDDFNSELNEDTEAGMDDDSFGDDDLGDLSLDDDDLGSEDAVDADVDDLEDA